MLYDQRELHTSLLFVRFPRSVMQEVLEEVQAKTAVWRKELDSVNYFFEPAKNGIADQVRHFNLPKTIS